MGTEGNTGLLAEAEAVEARLGDLDVKAPEGGKVKQWRETERRLLAESWYGGSDAEEEGCRLQRLGDAAAA